MNNTDPRKQKCTAITKKNDTRCRLQAIPGELFCKFHHPSEYWKQRVKIMQSNGGKSLRGIRLNMQHATVKDERDVVRLMAKLQESVMSGKYSVDIKDFTAISKIAEIYLKAKEKADEAQRLEKVEKKLDRMAKK